MLIIFLLHLVKCIKQLYVFQIIFSRFVVYLSLLHLRFESHAVNLLHIFSMQPPKFSPTHNSLWPSEKIEIIVLRN